MSNQAIKDLAREYTRRTLAQSATFHQLGVDELIIHESCNVICELKLLRLVL